MPTGTGHAEKKAAGKWDVPTRRASVLQAGLNIVINLVEIKKAQLVVITHDKDPVELVVFLPALCGKIGVLYCIIKGKVRLGQVVQEAMHHSCLYCCLNSEDSGVLGKLVRVIWPIMTDTVRFAATVKVMSLILNMWLAYPSWKMPRPKNLPLNWVK